MDIFIPYRVPAYLIELALEGAHHETEDSHGDAWHLIKGIIEVDEETTVTFPLIEPTDRELEFYRWGRGRLASAR